MKQVTLTASTGKRTTQLGFGCAYVSSAKAAILDAAYEAGIRHFDVARSYNHGQAEKLLGHRLHHWRGVTVTTKYGLKPPYRNTAEHAFCKAVRGTAAKLGVPAPAWSARYARKASFTRDDLMASLRLSRKALGRDHIDLLLLHEASAEDLAVPDLLETLLQLQSQGVIGDFGVGGPAHRLPNLVETRPQWCRVLQYDWSPLSPVQAPPGTRAIFYRSFAPAARELAARITDDKRLAQSWSATIGVDVAAPGMLASLLLRAALTSSPEALVLFSTSKPENIRHAVLVAEDATLDVPAQRLVKLATA